MRSPPLLAFAVLLACRPDPPARPEPAAASTPTTAEPSPPPPATCDAATAAATALWTRHRDRLAPLAIRALADATPAVVGVGEAAVDFLAALQRLRSGGDSVAPLRDRLREAATIKPAGDVPTAERDLLAVLLAARQVETDVVRRRGHTDLRWVSLDPPAEALKRTWEQRGEARVEALVRAARAANTWQIADLAARPGADLEAIDNAARLLEGDATLADARAATSHARTRCPVLAAPPVPAPTPGPRHAIGPSQWRTDLDDSGYVPTDIAGIIEVGPPRDRTVLIGGPLAVVALDADRGKPRWRRRFSSGGEGQWRIQWSPGREYRFVQLLADGDTVYASDTDHTLHALDLRTGDDRWTVELAGGLVSTPVLHAGRLFAASRYGEVVALDANTGARLLARMYGGATTPLLVADGRLHLADSDGFLLALDPASLDLLAITRVARDAPEAGPVHVAGRVVVADQNGRLTAVDARTGLVRWTRDLAAEALALVPADDAVVFLGVRGTLVALDITTGEPRWARAYPYGEGSLPDETADVAPGGRAPVRHGDTLLLGFRWPPALVAVDLRTGLAIARITSPDGSSFRGTVGVGDGKLYAYTAQSHLHAFTAADPARPVPPATHRRQRGL